MASEEDRAQAARVAGKLLVAATVAWELDVGGVGIRCRRMRDGFAGEQGRYIVESRVPNGRWERLTTGGDAHALLVAIAQHETVRKLIEENR